MKRANEDERRTRAARAHSRRRRAARLWVLFVARAFGGASESARGSARRPARAGAKVRRPSRTPAVQRIAAALIAGGVAALIVVMSAMNGFQLSFIDAILEISSYHVRAEGVDRAELEQWARGERDVISVVPFVESFGFAVGPRGAAGVLVRGVPPDVMARDAAFERELRIVSGEFDLSTPDACVLGDSLARQLGARCGSAVSVVSAGGEAGAEGAGSVRRFTVKGIFFSGYSNINAAYSFVPLRATDGGQSGGRATCGVKVRDRDRAEVTAKRCAAAFPRARVTSWHEYNRSFFAVLRTEKNLLFAVVMLIFVVVGINIFNSMSRAVLERRREIAILSALGARRRDVRAVFMLQGLRCGITGAVPGAVLGVLLARNMGAVFRALSKVQLAAERAWALITRPGMAAYVTENPMYAVYARIPARVFPREVAAIALFGVAAALLASVIASRKALKLNVAEELHDE